MNSPSVYLSLTTAQVERIKIPAEGEAFYRDSALPGFGLKVSSRGAKSFFVEGRVRGKGRTRRKVLGRFPAVSCEDARSKALVYLSEFNRGRDPIADDVLVRADDHNPTVARVLEDYLEARRLKTTTGDDYRKVLKWGAEDWLPLPLAELDRDQIQARHRLLGARSHARANYLMRVLRALFNYAIEAYRIRGKALITENPVLLLSRVGAWYRVPRKRTVIKAHELPAWFKAVDGLQGERKGEGSQVVRDYLRFLIFTGARRTEAATLRRQQIDLQAKTFTFLETKNREDHALPMSTPVWEILARRMDEGGEWAFPGSTEGHLGDCRYWLDQVRELSGVAFTPHDLRRTFTTVAESIDLSGYTLKRLLNHKLNQADVTAGYIVTDVERLRAPMERIATRLLELSNGP